MSEVETLAVRMLRSVYAPVLRWSLTNRKITVALGVVFLVVSGFLGSELGSEFLPTLEEGNLWIRASLPPTISLEAGMPYVTRNPRDPAAPPGNRNCSVSARPA